MPLPTVVTAFLVASSFTLPVLAGQKNATNLAKSYPGSAAYPSESAWVSLTNLTNNNLKRCPDSTLLRANLPLCGAPILQASHILLAQTAREISTALAFATENNLRVTVRNTGHDFLARHSGEHALTIVTGGMKGSEWTDTWIPTAGSEEFKEKMRKEKQSAVIIEAGMTWSEVVTGLRKVGHMVVTGADSSVGASGGWTMGGGHGPYSNQYGLGCDNVLEMDIVLTNGTILTTNSDSYPDLFFALRGGGGSTFGVVTRTTMKTFVQPTMNSVMLSVTHGSTGLDGYLDAMAYFYATMPNLTDFGISGYPVMTQMSYGGAQTAPGKSVAEIQGFLEPIAQRMRGYGANVTVMGAGMRMGGLGKGIGGAARGPAAIKIRDVLGEYHEELIRQAVRQTKRELTRRQTPDMSPVTNIPTKQMTSRLIARSALNEANMPAIKTMLKNSKGYLLPYAVAGGQVTRNRNLDVSVNPAWRDATIHLIAVNFDIISNTKAIDPLSVNHAAYLNEGWDHEEDWKTTYWGPKENYDKLLALKRKYDPTNTLWCMPCVGGDVFVEEKGKLYVA